MKIGIVGDVSYNHLCDILALYYTLHTHISFILLEKYHENIFLSLLTLSGKCGINHFDDFR